MIVIKEKDLRINLLLDIYSGLLTDKQVEALELYYQEDLSLAEIAEHTGITRQGVRDNIKRGEQLLYDIESKLCIVAKFGTLEKDVNDVIQLTQLLKQDSGRINSNDIICAFDTIKEKLEKYLTNS